MIQIGINICVKGAGVSGPPPAPVNTVLPVISGSTTLGSVLTTTNGTWINSPSSFTYQWKRNATNIGTNANTYTLVLADSGADITCVVTAINGAGSTSATSNIITAQTYSAPAIVSAPVISGSTTLGSVLTTTDGVWTGNPTPTFTYQWKRGATNIGTNSSTYTLVLADSNSAITCVVTATNVLGSNNSTSNIITADNYAPVNTVLPVISGSTTLGSVLTTTNGTWINSPSSFTYQWKRNATNIGTNANTYTLVLADSGADITCVVTAINGAGSTSATSNIITAQTYSAPAIVSAPVISGSTTLGSVLTTTDGVWTGNPTPTFTYQWKRGATNIGTNSSTYTLVLADSNSAITCVVTATNVLGSNNSTSNIITADNYAPVNTVLPVISGSTTLGSVLTTTNGTWINSPSSFTYQWKRNATNIGTNANTYTLVLADSGADITCVVTAINGAGSTSATSNIITAQTYSAPAIVSAPVISGSTTLGSVLTTTDGVWTGNPTPTFTYQWKRGATNIGTNSSTYTLVLADSNSAITCVVTATNVLGSNNSTSNIITADNYAPVNTTPPALSFSLRYEGELVTTDNGTWDNSPTSFTYQWYRDATPISGETLNEYTLDAADADTYVSCEVTAINAGGSSTPEPSDAIYIYDYDYGQVYYQYEDTDEAKSILQNQFMLAIKAAGVWAKLDVLCVFRGSGGAQALIDWKRLTTVTNINCTFDSADGFTGKANNSEYIDTGFAANAGTNYTQNNASRYFFPYNFIGKGAMDGTIQGGGGSRNKMLVNNSTSHRINQNGTVPLSSSFQYTGTVEPKSIHRTSATDVTLFNGTTSASRTAASDVLTGANLYILRDTNDYADHTVAAYATGASMVAENTAFVAAWNTYITAL
jgi:hypothetical protein